ncbi:phosphatidate cytidylyltransferase [Mycoplasma sp. 'Moose RK']|uniref:phosphatidate cytidylyltransferase n=1 Tax=Mycoplasma sp. 'Moose RK' TaxID=2780095 RepID=UPI0018C29B88|nr:phosphatidate cytidylyltransferase [Mycoplasma sp. 'Moose RK']MBG0730548.1 phosphatidate cytidylyltransferase [Mycoplasma sp. 'Moose RK']
MISNRLLRLQKDFLRRILSIFLILIVVLPILFIGHYVSFYGRIISFVCFALVLFYSLFEVFKHFSTKKFFTFLLAFFAVFLFISPSNISSYENLFAENINFGWSFIASYIKKQFLNYDVLIVLFLAFVVQFFDKSDKNRMFITDFFLRFLTILFASISFKILWILNIFNIFLVFFLFTIAVISDSFGYVFGYVFGKKIFKKNFNFSPNKSIEGFIASLFFTLIFAIAVILNTDFKIETKFFPILKVLMIILLPLGAIFGDMFFSMIKRYLKIKDFSNLIKGHGGFFDRFDSSSFVFLFFAFFVLFLT